MKEITMADTSDVLIDLEESELDQPINNPITDAEIEAAYANISFRVVYQTHNYFLPQLKDLIENREILNLRPEYQRRLRWTNKQKSLLIESLFLNIPIPPIFLYESDLARYEVMDGQQRLNAIHSYLLNDFNLVGVDKLGFLNGKRYNQLPPKLKRALDRAGISAIVLLQETRSDKNDPYLVRRYVFERLNTGGQKLNPQEMRNSIYRGKFNDLIVELARNPDFCEIFSIPKYTETDENEYYENPERQKNTLYKTMADCQVVLRFFALSRDEFITGSMRNILDKEMDRNKGMSDSQTAENRALFEDLISKSRTIFGDRPFDLEGDDGRARISVALFDALMGALVRRRTIIPALIAKSGAVQNRIELLKKTRRELLTGQANTAQAIKDRIQAVIEVLDAT